MNGKSGSCSFRFFMVTLHKFYKNPIVHLILVCYFVFVIVIGNL